MIFEKSLETFGDRIALIENDQSCTYRELADRCDRFADRLGEAKKLVAVMATPTTETVVAYLGALRGGHAVMMLDASMPKEATERLLRRYRPEWVVDDKGEPIAYDAPATAIYPATALLLGTSGSTGSAKMVRLSLENLHANCASILGYLPITAEDRAISMLPLHYSYGLSVLHTHLAVGATFVLCDASIMSKVFWEAFKKHAITNFNGVPYHYTILQKLRFEAADHPHLRFMTQAGGKLPPSLVRHFVQNAQKADIPFFVMYGQTEATARIAYLDPAKAARKPESIGRAIPGVSLTLDRPDPKTGIAELVCRGPNVMLGYAEAREDLAEGDTCQGVLKTGDLAVCDAEGDFTVVGRKKRFIKLFGHRVSLDSLEARLRDDGFDAVATGEDDALILFTRSDVAALRAYLAQTLKLSAQGIEVVAVDRYIVKESGKIDYLAMRERYGA